MLHCKGCDESPDIHTWDDQLILRWIALTLHEHDHLLEKIGSQMTDLTTAFNNEDAALGDLSTRIDAIAGPLQQAVADANAAKDAAVAAQQAAEAADAGDKAALDAANADLAAANGKLSDALTRVQAETDKISGLAQPAAPAPTPTPAPADVPAPDANPAPGTVVPPSDVPLPIDTTSGGTPLAGDVQATTIPDAGGDAQPVVAPGDPAPVGAGV